MDLFINTMTGFPTTFLYLQISTGFENIYLLRRDEYLSLRQYIVVPRLYIDARQQYIVAARQNNVAPRQICVAARQIFVAARQIFVAAPLIGFLPHPCSEPSNSNSENQHFIRNTKNSRPPNIILKFVISIFKGDKFLNAEYDH